MSSATTTRLSVNRWSPSDLVEELKPRARVAGLWNLFLSDEVHGAGLTNLEYASL
jgi:acyl-CoA dehydrogenase